MVHVLVPGNCEYVLLHSQRDFADMIKYLEVGRYFALFRWPKIITWLFKSKEPFLVVVRKRGDGGRVRDAALLALRRKGPQAKGCGQPLEGQKG